MRLFALVCLFFVWACADDFNGSFAEVADEPPPAFVTFMQKMTRDNWTKAGMSMWADLETDFLATCRNCHDTGTGGFFIHGDVERDFSANQKWTFARGFFAQDLAGAVVPALGKISYALIRPGHPTLGTDARADVFPRAAAALEQFVTLTNN